MAHQVLEELQKFAYSTNHKQGVTKLLNKCLLMVTFENGENFSIRFEMKKKHYLLSTTGLAATCYFVLCLPLIKLLVMVTD